MVWVQKICSLKDYNKKPLSLAAWLRGSSLQVQKTETEAERRDPAAERQFWVSYYVGC